ncbi:MAG: ribonuclease P protein component [Anaerolineales bacterium]
MSKLARLKSATDFERVRRDGRSHAHPLAVLSACRQRPPGGESAPPPTRYAFVAGKRVGTAVARNRAKRLLREAARARHPEVAPGWDLIFIARAPLAEASLEQAREVVGELLRRARVVKE